MVPSLSQPLQAELLSSKINSLLSSLNFQATPGTQVYYSAFTSSLSALQSSLSTISNNLSHHIQSPPTFQTPN